MQSLKRILGIVSISLNVLLIGGFLWITKHIGRSTYFVNKETSERVIQKILKGKKIVIYKDRIITKDRIINVPESGRIEINENNDLKINRIGFTSKLDVLYNSLGVGIGWRGFYWQNVSCGFGLSYPGTIEPIVYVAYRNPIRLFGNTYFHVGRSLERYFWGIGVSLSH